MLLNELLDSEVPFRVTMALSRNFSTEAMIAGRKITFGAISYPDDGITTWKVFFSEKQGDGTTLKATGNGGEFQVFNVVVKSMLELVRRYNPERIVFTSSKDEDSSVARANLYARLFHRFKVPGYTMTREDNSGAYSFELIRDDVNQEDDYEERTGS